MHMHTKPTHTHTHTHTHQHAHQHTNTRDRFIMCSILHAVSHKEKTNSAFIQTKAPSHTHTHQHTGSTTSECNETAKSKRHFKDLHSEYLTKVIYKNSNIKNKQHKINKYPYGG